MKENNMIHNILTSFNEKYWQEIAETTVGQLDLNWPDSDKIFLYHQLNSIPKKFKKRTDWIDLYSSCPDLPKFVEKWKDHPKANGAKNFRTNAVKFVHKTFAIWNQAKLQKEGWLIWLDVDAFVYKKIDKDFLNRVCPNEYSISFMGRPGKYSECGWIGFNLSHPKTMDFILEWERLYLSGDFIDLPETHDSWTFDYIRKNWNRPDLFFNVNSAAKTKKHPFSQSMIGTHIVHAKGAGKDNLIERFKNRLV
jgi:hypothetical protein